MTAVRPLRTVPLHAPSALNGPETDTAETCESQRVMWFSVYTCPLTHSIQILE